MNLGQHSAGFGPVISHLDDATTYLDPIPAAVVVAAWTAFFVGITHTALSRRDA